MSGYLTNAGGALALEELLRSAPRYLSLLDTEPTTLGTVSGELAGGGYVRQLITWTVPSSKTSAIAAEVVFDDLPDGVVRWFGIHTAQSGGSMLVAIQRTLADGVTPDPVTVASNQSLRVPINDLVVTL